MSGDGGWENLFAPLGSDGKNTDRAPDPVTPDRVVPDGVDAGPLDPEAFRLTPSPAQGQGDPFAAMRERQEAAQRAAADAAAAATSGQQAPVPAGMPSQPVVQTSVPAADAAASSEPPLTRRELRERERSGETGAISTTPVGASTTSAEVPPLVEPPVATAAMTGPVFAAAWSAAAPPRAASVDAEEPSPAESVPAPSTPTADDAPSWFAAAQAVAAPTAATPNSTPTAAQTSPTPPVDEVGALFASTPPPTTPPTATPAASTAAPAPVVRSHEATGLEDWRPRPVAGGGFPIPITVGGGAAGGAGGGGSRGGSGGSGAGGGSRPAPKPRRSKRWLAILIPILVILGLLGAAGVWAWSNYEEQIREVLGLQLPNDYESTGNGEEVVVTIRSGDIGEDVARTLHDSGVTMTFDAFYDLLLEQDPEPVFEAGNYTLQREMSAVSALAALQDEANKLTSRLVIPEGSVLPDVLAIMSSTTGIPLEEFQSAAADPQSYGLPAEAPSLEGYLFPATYELDGAETATELIQRLVNETFTRLDVLTVPVEDRHRVLTLAALVQRESGPIEGDPAKVARVFLNRLDIGMNLESDATVAYGTGNLHTVWTTDEERADASNPYNTYANPGLPIGPIGAPGEVAIQAVLTPADGPWLFFVPINLATGETMFSETVEEHEKWADYLRDVWCEESDENAAYCE
jgi:UPF0755 protein